jgi:hypothetical protein
LSLFEWDLKKCHFLTAKYEGLSHLHCKLSLPELQNGSLLALFGLFGPFLVTFLNPFLAFSYRFLGGGHPRTEPKISALLGYFGPFWPI